MTVPKVFPVSIFAVGLAMTLIGALLFADVLILGASTEDDCQQRCFGQSKCCVKWTQSGQCWKGIPGNTSGSCTINSTTLSVCLMSVGGALALIGILWFSLFKDYSSSQYPPSDIIDIPVQ